MFRVEARFAGVEGDGPVIDLQLILEDRVLLAMRLIDRLFPLGGLADATALARRAFLRDADPADGVGFSRTRDDRPRNRLDPYVELAPRNVERIYHLSADIRGDEGIMTIAMKEHIGRLLAVHPSAVKCDLTKLTSWLGAEATDGQALHLTWEPDRLLVRNL